MSQQEGRNMDVLLPEEDMYEDDFEMGDDEIEEDEEVFAADDGSQNSDSTNKWDRTISALEELLLNEGFEKSRTSFCRQHCHEFEDTPENKLVYTGLFQQYCAMLEQHIEGGLAAAVPGFSMEEFGASLADRQGELDAEVFDLLMSMSEFSAFKELMLAHKAELAAGAQQQLMGLQCCAVPVHREEQEDGEERPDLDMSLSVSPLMSPAAAAAAAGAGGKAGAAAACGPVTSAAAAGDTATTWDIAGARGAQQATAV